MKNERFVPLTHPVFSAALLLVCVNALILQPNSPSWLSGKLGDAAWIIVAPLLVASFFVWLAPESDRRKLGLASIFLTGIIFSLLKTVPALNQLTSRAFFSLFQLPLKLALDPSDLLVLPFIGLAWLVWNSHYRPPASGWLRLGALGLAMLALVADSPAPQSIGFTCLIAKDNRIYAFRESLYRAYFSGEESIIWLFYSTDGGLTWTRDDQAIDTKKETCSPQISWPVTSSLASGLEYDFVPGKGIYTSHDNGKTLVFGQEVGQVTGVYQDQSTGNVIFTAGREGVIVHTPDDQWQVTLKDADY